MSKLPYSIALAGKGGTGKTTVAGLLVKYLVKIGKTPVLAVDADANANFNEVLGLVVTETLGEAREEMKKGASSGITKDVFMQMKLEQAVVEAEGYDLVVMGRPEGSGCYCAANTLLTTYLDRLMGNYASVVMDNEAGMEHMSRMTTNNMNVLLVVSDSSRRGIQAAARIFELADELALRIEQKHLIVNQAQEAETEAVAATARQLGLEVSGIIPEDHEVREYDRLGTPTIRLDENNKAVQATFRIFELILQP